MSRFGYDRLKRCDFRCWWNKDSDWADVVSCGRAFQIRGPATGKARLPMVESLTEGTDRRLVPAKCSARRPGRSATGTKGPRYRGALPCTALYVNTAILYMDRQLEPDMELRPQESRPSRPRTWHPKPRTSLFINVSRSKASSSN